MFGTIPLVVDEVLSQRLGLIPPNVDPARVTMKESTSFYNHFRDCHSNWTFRRNGTVD